MAVERLVPEKEREKLKDKSTLKEKFKTRIQSANTVAELRVALRILGKHVFGEKDDE